MIFLTIVALSLLHATSGAPGWFDLEPGEAPIPTDGLNRFSEKVSVGEPSGQNSSSEVFSSQDLAELGEKAFASISKNKLIHFNDGPYFPMEKSGSKSGKLIKEFSFSNFSLITSGQTIDKGADFWIEKELFKTGETIEAERITGVVGVPLQLFEGYISILTTRSTDWHDCKVLGSSREFSPIGRDYDYYGNPGIKILFQDTVVKKPFPYVVNDYMIDASTRPIYSLFNGTVGQPFHFDYHIDPTCGHGFNETELAIVERAIGSALKKLLRPLIMDFVRKSYLENVIAPYASSIGAKVDIDAESQPKLKTQSEIWGPPP